jgi:UDP-N-acetylglucosamine 2-epimerase (non-hydrolysing)
VHTGQHYDALMSDDFFKQLEVAVPDVNFGVHASSHATQTAEIMEKMETFCLEFKPDIVAIFGDTNSSLATALTAAKMKIPVAHLEAGGREFEMDIPEEINRRIIDQFSNLLLAVSEVCVKNLQNEHVLGKIFNTGDPLYEVFEQTIKDVKKIQLIPSRGFSKDKYILLTLHRDKNVDNLEKFEEILSALASFNDVKFVFPVHPRAKKQLDKLRFHKNTFKNFIFIEPVSYKEILNLILNSKLVITDSGGLQKEAFWCKKPCITLRQNTSWTELVDYGLNLLCETKAPKIKNKINFVLKNYDFLENKFSSVKNPYYKENISKSNVKLLKQFAGKKW